MATQPLPIALEPITHPEVDGYRYFGLLAAKMHEAHAIETAAEWVVEVLTYCWDLSMGAIWWMDRSKEVVRLYECIGDLSETIRQAIELTIIAEPANPVMQAIEQDQAFTRDLAYFQQDNLHIRLAVQDGLTHGMWAPVHLKDRTIGVLELVDRQKFAPVILDQLQVGIQILEQYVMVRKTVRRWQNLAIYCRALSDILTKAKPQVDAETILEQALKEYCATVGALYFRLWMPNEEGLFTLRAQDGLLEDLSHVSTGIPDPVTQMAIRTGRMAIEHDTTNQDWTGEFNLFENGVRSMVALLVTDHIGCPFAAITIFLPQHPDNRDDVAMGIMESLADHLYLVVKVYIRSEH